MKRIAAKFAPRLLNVDQREYRVQVCTELQGKDRDDPNFMLKVITANETWVYGYNPETNQFS